MREIKPLAPKPVDAPAAFDLADVAALKAMEQGSADANQQQRALDWIMRFAADVGGTGFRGEAPMALAFHEGRRFVGQQIMGLLRLDTQKLKDDK